MKRHWEIDALRGLMLVLMTVTHLPTHFTDPLGQPFGWVSAAEGFVLLSAFMAGLVYSRYARRDGVESMRSAFWRRVLKIYVAHAALLLFLFTVITALGIRRMEPAVTNLVSWYLAQPAEGFVFGLLLIYEPALLDILPMYIFFMLLSPWVLAFALRHQRWGWPAVMVASAALWIGAQYGMSEWLYGWTFALTGLPVPFNEMGAFNAYAWQFLWFGGLWLGFTRSAPHARPLRLHWAVVLPAVVVALVGLYWRHFGEHGQAPFGADIARNLWVDKWQLGPLRLLNLIALGIVAIRFGPTWARWLPRVRWLETLGRASLPAFCAHLVAVLTVLAIFGDSQTSRPWWADTLLLAVVLAWMWAVARYTQNADAAPPEETVQPPEDLGSAKAIAPAGSAGLT
ncbi:OpgC domain-containing protein [uncultured Pseudacidovorax sp.]|uniref:OpgC domain-containing protein n=1 Tax=uncultured Pseudacidovorax sp. TaxID=679313 RepID=UPI0025E4A706|nr:OpgC domain-containing protein [uncultured Pseudacidovorax sp.]